jgi:predicted alpha/beta hydrolase
MPPLWFLLIPIIVAMYGYANAEKIGQGENLPKGVALQWRKWCINPNYFEDHFKNSSTKLFFDKYVIPLKSIQIDDDPIATKITANKLVGYFKNAKIEVETISPLKMGVRKIGHTGFFSRKFKDTLWKKLIADIERNSLLS